MSLIYEALRKSEQQRRLGETPTLTTPPSWTPRRRRPYRGVAFAAIVVALAAGAWWLGRASLRDEANERTAAATAVPEPSVATATPPSETGVARLPATTSAPAATPATIEPVPPPEPVSAASPVVPAAADAPSAIAPELQRRLDAGEIFANSPDQLATKPPTSEQAYVPPDAALPEPLPDHENAPVAGVPGASVPPPPARMAADPNAIATVVTPPRTPAPAPEPVAAPPPVTTLAEDAAVAAAAAAAAPVVPRDAAAPVPYLFELPLATRRELPPLKLNMHVYSDDPTHRFVIVDGSRAAEGGNVASDLDVVEIRNDGVVLAFRGMRFLLPRSGG